MFTGTRSPQGLRGPRLNVHSARWKKMALLTLAQCSFNRWSSWGARVHMLIKEQGYGSMSVWIASSPDLPDSWQTGLPQARRARRRPSGARVAGARAGWAASTTRPSSPACPPCCRPRSPGSRRSSTCVSTTSLRCVDRPASITRVHWLIDLTCYVGLLPVYIAMAENKNTEPIRLPLRPHLFDTRSKR